jgi:hypothetical protein
MKGFDDTSKENKLRDFLWLGDSEEERKLG